MISTLVQDIKDLFPNFEPELLDFISINGNIREVRAGEMLMTPGQYFRNTMLVLNGRIKVHKDGEEGEEYFLYYIEPGQACALSMICASKNEQSMIKATANEDTTVVAIPIQMMDQMMRDYKSWYYFVMETYRSRFEELLNVIDNVAFKSMDERLEFYLKNQFDNLNTNQINITHQQIASDLSSSREVISRLLKKMEQRGIIELGRNRITRLEIK